MKIVRVEAWNFRGIDHALLDDLASDLSLVLGPNESGKSRIFEALRCAMFEKHKGESAEKTKLRSWGGTESPVVEVHFEAAGVSYQVKKRFLKGASAKLEGGGRTWTDDDAEEKLRALWGTREIKGRKESDPFLGLWPLLWVEQGESGIAPHAHLNDDARAKLRDVLAVHVNEIAAGVVGERVLRRVDAERLKYWTERAGKESGELAEARAKLEAAEVLLAANEKKKDDVVKMADELARVDRDREGIDARIAAAREAVAVAKKRADEAREIDARLRNQASEVARLGAEKKMHAERLEQHAARAKERDEATARIAEARADATRFDARSEEFARALAQAKDAVEKAELVARLAGEERLRATRQAARAAAERRAEDAKAACDRARADEKRVLALVASLEALKVSEREIKAIRASHEKAAAAAAALEAASAMVRVRALAPIAVDGIALAKGEERAIRCDDDALITIDGVAEVRIAPGAHGLDALRDAAKDGARALQEKLDACGATTRADAEAKYTERATTAAALEQARAVFAVVAPRGMGALEEAMQAAEAARDALGPRDPEAPSLDEVEARLVAADDALRAKRAARDEAAEIYAKGREDATQAKHELARWTARHAELAQRIAAETPDATKAALDETTRAWLAAEELRAALEAELRRTGGNDAVTDLERESRALEQRVKERAALHDRSTELRATLKHAGGEDLHEAVQRALSERELAAESFARIKSRADAVDLLKRTLDETRRALQERLVAPVLDRVHPYLRELFPDAKLRINEQWEILGLSSANVEEDFDALSFGAKEQVSILVRLALAEVLGERESLPIVLDDCLVNTDPERHDAMIRVLYRASKKQQIILFSCNQRAFDRLGETRRIELSPRRRT